MTRTLSLFLVISLSFGSVASMLGKPAKASTWHSDIAIDGYYCPGGGKRAHLEQCPKNHAGKRGQKGGRGQSPRRPTAAVRQACGGDAIRLCGAVIKDLKARRACMKAHKAELSAACKAALAK
jgi:hypothetical protein